MLNSPPPEHPRISVPRTRVNKPEKIGPVFLRAPALFSAGVDSVLRDSLPLGRGHLARCRELRGIPEVVLVGRGYRLPHNCLARHALVEIHQVDLGYELPGIVVAAPHKRHLFAIG